MSCDQYTGGTAGIGPFWTGQFTLGRWWPPYESFGRHKAGSTGQVESICGGDCPLCDEQLRAFETPWGWTKQCFSCGYLEGRTDA